MKQNYSQKLGMQIPKENSFTGLLIIDNDNMLQEFLKKHFKFPSHNLNEIYNFIEEDKALERIIYDFPKIVSKELAYTKISFDFMKETDSNEKILEIIIYSDLNENESFQKEDIISDGIIDKYPKTINEFIILVEQT